MSTTPDHYINVLKFWRSIETFNLPDLPIPSRGKDAKVYSKLEPGASLPWRSEAFSGAEGDKQWRHTLYFYVVAKEAVVELLAKLSGSKDFREPVSGQTFLSALVVDHLGQPVDRGYMPAAFIYGIKIIQEKKDPEELPELLRVAQEEFLQRSQTDKRPSKEGPDKPLQHILDWPVLE